MSNFSYKSYALEVMHELSKSDDEMIVYKFMKELCKLCRLRQFDRFKSPRLTIDKEK